MKKCFFSGLLTGLILLASCTYTITMVHTEGTASDVVDETETNTPTIPITLSKTGI